MVPKRACCAARKPGGEYMMCSDGRIVDIINRLVEARKSTGLTQAQAAHMVGLSAASSLSMYEARGSVPDLRLFLALCDVYAVSPTWALTGVKPDIDPALIGQVLELLSEAVRHG